LTAITVNASNPAYSSVAGVLFNKSTNALIQFPGGKAVGYTIPNSVTTIADYAFAFISLTNIAIPNSVTNIAEQAFIDCNSLTNITIGTNVTSIGAEAFSGTSLSSVTLPNSVTTIEYDAFNSCHSLTSVIIPDSVTTIQGGAFGYTSLTNITIGTNVTNIGEAPFAGCIKLTAITVNASNPAYSSVAGVLFNKSTNTLIQYPGGKAGDYYAIPNSVTTIGGFAFVGTSLSRVTIPNSVTTIGEYAFYYCNSLSNVTIGTNVTTIEEYAFCNTSLSSITIPNSVTNIGADAFAYTGLTRVYFAGNAPSADSTIFFRDGVTAYYVPGATGWSEFCANTGIPVECWLPNVQSCGTSYAMQRNQFGFNITWASGQIVVVEACTNLANPVWQPVYTNTLTGGSPYFSDPQWTNYPARFYRLRSP
jgi:hypothetical protein